MLNYLRLLRRSQIRVPCHGQALQLLDIPHACVRSGLVDTFFFKNFDIITSFKNQNSFLVTTFVAVLKSDPKKEDFLDIVKFNELIGQGHSSLQLPGTDCCLMRNVSPTVFNIPSTKHLVYGFYSSAVVSQRRAGEGIFASLPNICLLDLPNYFASVFSICSG